MAPYNYKTIVGPWEGVDYRPNDLERSDNAAADMLNAHVTPDNLITQRPGTIYAGKAPGSGSTNIGVAAAFPTLVGYIPLSSNSPTLTPSVAAFTDSPTSDRSLAYTVTASVTLPTTSPWVRFDANFPDGQFHLQVLNSSDTVILDVYCGAGTESPPILPLSNLVSTLAAAGVSASVSGDAASLALAPIQSIGPFDTREQNLSLGGSFTRDFQIWSAALVLNAIDNTKFLLSSFDRVSNACDSVTWSGTTTYFTDQGSLYAFDGVRALTPGVPAYIGANFTFDTGTSGNVDVGSRLYGFQLRYYDANGGFADGPMITNAGTSFSDLTKGWSASVASSPKEVKITYAALGSFSSLSPLLAYVQPPTLTGVTSGSGSSSPVTTLSFSSNPFIVGDQIIASAYNAAGNFISSVDRARVLDADSTTVTLDGGGLTYRSGGTFSRNMTILVWRQKITGTEYNLVGEVPFNPAGATIIDNTADANLGSAYVAPEYVQGSASLAGFNETSSATVPFGSPIPYFNAVAIHDNLLVAASGNTVFYSLPDELFNWSADQNSFVLPLKSEEEIIAVKSFGAVLYIWATNSLYQVTGSLPQPGVSGTFLLSKISESIGCSNLRSIAIVEDKLAWLANDGFYSLTPGAYPNPIDLQLRPLYVGKQHAAVFVGSSFGYGALDYGNASYDPYRKLYVCSFNLTNFSNSMITLFFVWNIAQGGIWGVWNNLDTTQGNLFVQGLGTFHVGLHNTLRRFSDNEVGFPEKYQAADGVNAIPFSFTGSWEAMGAPSIAKNYTRFRLLAGQSGGTEQHFTLGVNLQKDYSLGSAGSKTLDFNSTTGFGLEAYGMAPYGDPTKSGLNMKPLNSKARAMRPVFTNTNLYEKVKIMGWEYELSPDFKENKGNK